MTSRALPRTALAALLLAALPAAAQYNPPAAGTFGAEDGYGGDGFGWGPAYRPDTTFRPSYGFYGGVERPYPYGSRGDATGSIDAAGSLAPGRRVTAPRKAKRRPAGQTARRQSR